MDFLAVSTTTATREQARQIAGMLVQRRLAACVQVTGPIESTYWWQGEVQHSEEWLCEAKTNARCLPLLQRAIEDAHTYDVPQIVVTPITGGSEPYLQWLTETLKGQEKEPERHE